MHSGPFLTDSLDLIIPSYPQAVPKDFLVPHPTVMLKCQLRS